MEVKCMSAMLPRASSGSGLGWPCAFERAARLPKRESAVVHELGLAVRSFATESTRMCTPYTLAMK